MKNKIFIIVLLLVSLSASAQNQNKELNNLYSEESFAVFEASIGGYEAIGSFNLAYKDYKQKSAYPWCLRIGIALDLDMVYDNGLPNNFESSIAYGLEDELLEGITKITSAHYIGHVFNDSLLDIYIYLDSPEKVHQYLQTQVNKDDLMREFAYEIVEDSSWDNVADFLH